MKKLTIPLWYGWQDNPGLVCADRAGGLVINPPLPVSYARLRGCQNRIDWNRADPEQPRQGAGRVKAKSMSGLRAGACTIFWHIEY
jgi:hypothetical protein